MLNVLSLFAGIGGFDLGLERTGGFNTVAFCEIEPFCQKVLAKHWPKVPCYDDVKTLSRERLTSDGIAIDCIVGGFPCQDISFAGYGEGIADGTRSGLWSEFARLIGELRPQFVIVENVAALLSNGMERVLGDLATIGYDAEWHCIQAYDAGLPHQRSRIWIIAYPKCEGRKRPIADNSIFSGSLQAFTKPSHNIAEYWLQVVLDKCGLRTGNGVSLAMERRRLKALGNAVVPQIPELIGRAILESIKNERQ
jgi:DNA (cytosine-5)-methyltransferase 1